MLYASYEEGEGHAFFTLTVYNLREGYEARLANIAKASNWQLKSC